MARTQFSQVDLSLRLQYSEAHISRILSGERRPSLGLAVKIAHLTGIPATAWMDRDALEVLR